MAPFAAVKALRMKKRVKIELEDEDGTKYTLSLEGQVSREKLMKAVDMFEVMDVPLEQHQPRLPDKGTFFGRVMILLDTSFSAGDFTSADVAREFEDKYDQPVRLSTISTYLSRLAEKQYIKRERFGNSWVYRRAYLKSNQLAER
jgi:penicillinase repressor